MLTIEDRSKIGPEVSRLDMLRKYYCDILKVAARNMKVKGPVELTRLDESVRLFMKQYRRCYGSVSVKVTN